MSDPNPNPAADLATTLGHGQVTVKTITGQQETVLVKQLPLRQMRELALAIEDPGRVIQLCVGKPVEWIDRLTPDSFEALATEADRVNADFLARWARLQRSRVDRLGPLAAAAAMQPTA